MYKEHYHISNETIKIAISLVKNYLKEALNKRHNLINHEPINIEINRFKTTTDGTNLDTIKQELENYIATEFNDEDKDLIVILLIINIIGIIGIFITLNNPLLRNILIAIIVLGNIIFFYKLNHRNHLRTIEKNKLRNDYLNRLEKILAQTIDYQNILKHNETNYKELLVLIDNLDTKNYVTSNNERNIVIGE